MKRNQKIDEKRNLYQFKKTKEKLKFTRTQKKKDRNQRKLVICQEKLKTKINFPKIKKNDEK